jgi:hypothetical protein
MLSLGNSTVLLVLALLRLGRLKAGNRNINPFQVANKMAENRITTTASLLLWSVAPATDPWPRGSDVQNMRARVCVCARMFFLYVYSSLLFRSVHFARA